LLKRSYSTRLQTSLHPPLCVCRQCLPEHIYIRYDMILSRPPIVIGFKQIFNVEYFAGVYACQQKIVVVVDLSDRRVDQDRHLKLSEFENH